MRCAQPRSVWPVAAVSCLVFFAAAELPAAVYLLSAGQAFSFVEDGGPGPTVTPDGHYVVYCQDAETDGKHELWSAPLAGGDPVRISRPLLPGGFACRFRISSDGATVVYSELEPGAASLLATAVDGSTAAFPLTPAAANPIGYQKFRISPDGATVVYIADPDVDQRDELFSVPIEGGNPVKVSGPLVAGGDVTHFAISPDGAYIVYRADQAEDERFALYGVLIVGGTWWPISGFAPFFNPNSDVMGFAVSPIGWVVYIQDLLVDEKYELRSIPIEMQGGYQLNDNLASNRDVLAFGISPNGTRAVYFADQDVDEQFELYSVPVDDAGLGGNVVKLNGPPAAGGDVDGDFFVISPDSSRVVYVADEEVNDRPELYSVPIGGGTRVRLNQVLPPDSNVLRDLPLVSPDSSRVAYRIRHNAASGFADLFSVAIGGGSAVPLSPVLPNGIWSVERLALAGGGAHVFFEFRDLSTRGGPTTTLSRVPLAGGEALSSGPTLELDSGQAFELIVPAVDPRQVLFIANPGGGFETELYLGDVCVFCDGFESGGTVRWSAVVP